MKPADPDWDALLERLDLGDGDLDAAEQRLQRAQADPLTEAWVQAQVDAAGRAPAPLATRRRWRARAALLPAALLLAAATSVVVWIERRHSADTLSFAQAIELLLRADQSPELRRSALLATQGRARFGIATMQQVRDGQHNPAELREAASARLAALAALFDATDLPWPTPAEQDLAAAADGALAAGGLLAERGASLDRLATLTAAAVTAVLGISRHDQVLGEDSAIYRDHLRTQLRR